MFADRGVVVHLEPELFRVEGLGAIHIRHWDNHYLERPIHDLSFSLPHRDACSERSVRAAGLQGDDTEDD